LAVTETCRTGDGEEMRDFQSPFHFAAHSPKHKSWISLMRNTNPPLTAHTGTQCLDVEVTSVTYWFLKYSGQARRWCVGCLMNNLTAKMLQVLDKLVHGHYETSVFQVQRPVEFSWQV